MDKLAYAGLPTFLDVSLTGPNIKGTIFGDTPLHIMAVWGDVESAQILIDEGAEIDARGEHDFTPLHEAVGQDKIEMVKLLLANGSNPNLKTSDGHTAFDLAELLNHHDVLVLLETERAK